MGAILTTSSTLNCPHGGTVTASPGSAHTKAGSAILRSSDSFVIGACSFQISGAPHPCTSVKWIVTAMKVKDGGDPVLTDASVGLCVAGDQAPQGAVLISPDQTKAKAL